MWQSNLDIIKKVFVAVFFNFALLAWIDYIEASDLQKLFYTCTLVSSEEEQMTIEVYAEPEAKVNLSINGYTTSGVYVPSLSEPNSSLTFATSIIGNTYTLVVHFDPFLPHPKGYEHENPPASLTIQNADLEVLPKVKTFFGNCFLK